MQRSFNVILCELRQENGLSQRKLAADLKISQALLSHYENGTREPGLPFICRACDYFGVSADYILGRTAICEISAPSSNLQYENELLALLSNADSKVQAAAEKYLESAKKRVKARLKRTDSELNTAELSAQMAIAELELLQALSSTENSSIL